MNEETWTDIIEGSCDPDGVLTDDELAKLSAWFYYYDSKINPRVMDIPAVVDELIDTGVLEPGFYISGPGMGNPPFDPVTQRVARCGCPCHSVEGGDPPLAVMRDDDGVPVCLECEPLERVNPYLVRCPRTGETWEG